MEVPERSNISLVCLGHGIPDQKQRERSVHTGNIGNTTSQDQTDKILVH